MKFRLFFVLVAFLGWKNILSGQSFSREAMGLTGGLSISLGTQEKRAGLSLETYYVQDFVQVNLTLRGLYTWSDWGLKNNAKGWQWHSGLGVLAAFGPPQQDRHPFLGLTSNQTGRQYAFGYGFHRYQDQWGTSQWTATLAIHLGRWMIHSENDAFTGRLDDKFRTGTFLVSYRDSTRTYGIHTLLWTGDPRSRGTRRVHSSETDYPSRNGYKDLRDAQFGRLSHGVMALEVQQVLPFGQIARGRLGVDAEQVRHFVQNQLIHDFPILPASWIKAKNPHYPMLTPEGLPYLYQEEQRIRRARFYLELSLNGGDTY
ncbi:MAG: polymorphic toxin type 23 domain-containing protein [Bacteroidota bacterium]